MRCPLRIGTYKMMQVSTCFAQHKYLSFSLKKWPNLAQITLFSHDSPHNKFCSKTFKVGGQCSSCKDLLNTGEKCHLENTSDHSELFWVLNSFDISCDIKLIFEPCWGKMLGLALVLQYLQDQPTRLWGRFTKQQKKKE